MSEKNCKIIGKSGNYIIILSPPTAPGTNSRADLSDCMNKLRKLGWEDASSSFASIVDPDDGFTKFMASMYKRPMQQRNCTITISHHNYGLFCLNANQLINAGYIPLSDIGVNRSETLNVYSQRFGIPENDK